MGVYSGLLAAPFLTPSHMMHPPTAHQGFEKNKETRACIKKGVHNEVAVFKKNKVKGNFTEKDKLSCADKKDYLRNKFGPNIYS